MCLELRRVLLRYKATVKCGAFDMNDNAEAMDMPMVYFFCLSGSEAIFFLKKISHMIPAIHPNSKMKTNKNMTANIFRQVISPL